MNCYYLQLVQLFMHALLLFTACRTMHAWIVTIYSFYNYACMLCYYLQLVEQCMHEWLLFTACTSMHACFVTMYSL